VADCNVLQDRNILTFSTYLIFFLLFYCVESFCFTFEYRKFQQEVFSRLDNSNFLKFCEAIKSDYNVVLYVEILCNVCNVYQQF